MQEKNQISRKIVVIGASAGGLTPLTKLIKNLRIDSSTSVIVAMHLSPRHHSFLSEILAKSSKYPVSMMQDGVKLATSHIYVVPPDRHAIIDELCCKLVKDDTTPQPNINMLLESVAKQDSVIPMGVILSGNGSDGTKGLLNLKIQGGLSFVQEPNSADYDSMPNSAIESDAADFILTAEEIGTAVSHIIKRNQFPDVGSLPFNEYPNRGISSILDFLYAERQIDLHNYKSTSLKRRIYRRVALGGFTDIAEYLAYLKQNSSELEALINDIFISVTQFMRDPRVWMHLHGLVVEYLNRGEGKILRVWCAGCSSGEEAYTWAIMLETIKSTYSKEFDYLIFATDISEKSIAHARRGVYDIAAVGHLDPSIVDKYFTQNQYGYQVSRYLRDKIVFSIHNLLLDPPFSNIDFLSCRNVLIYFNHKLQKRALANFGYGLLKDGYLVMGSSESVGQNQKYFIEHDKEKKIFQRTTSVTSQPVLEHSIRKTQVVIPAASGKKKQEVMLQQLVQAKVAEHSEYSALLIDDKDEILFTYGNVDLLLSLKTGRFSQSIFDYLESDHRASLRALILKCRRTQESVRHLENLGEKGSMLCTIVPVGSPENWLVIIIDTRVEKLLTKSKPIDSELEPDSRLVDELEAELTSTRMSLQTVVEELEQTNDALQSSNEELQSSNEELQATNEELQTTNEELQSSNEELRTLNEELRIKNTELDLVSSHLQSVEENLETPYILLSKDLCVIRFSKTIDLFSKTDDLELSDPLDDIPWLNPDATLRKSLHETTAKVIDDRQTRTLSGFKINQRRYDIAVKHYSDHQNRFSEIMLVFTDVTNRFNLAEQALGDFQKREQILNLLETGIIYTDQNGIVKYVNPEAIRYLQPENKKIIGEHIDRLLYVYLGVDSKFPEPGLFQRVTDHAFGTYIFGNQALMVKHSQGNRTIRLNASAAKDHESIEAWLFEIHDVSNETELSLRIEHGITHDGLTGLQNRRALEDRISRINQHYETVTSLVYVLIDIDHFKPINDIAGHVQGDLALISISEAILSCVRANDLLARIGGDEFALLLVDVNRQQAKQILESILKNIDALEIDTVEGQFNLSASVSWSYLEAGAEVDVGALYSNADEAMYLAKKAGGNALREFSLDASGKVQSISAILFERIKFSFKHGLLHFCFQPIVDLKNPKNQYFELLVRVGDHNDLMRPYEFMPVVERYNYTRQFDRYVFRHALEVINEIQQKTTAPLRFAINLSASAIEYPDVFDALADFPKIIGSRSVKLTLEITETAAIRDLHRAKLFIKRAQNLGIKVALDDFGVGFNGYHYLKELKVDTVKIDGEFINGIVNNQVDRIFVKSVIELSQVLNFETVAEFVDTEEKLGQVKALGFGFSQGYLHAEPLPLDKFYLYLDQ